MTIIFVVRRICDSNICCKRIGPNICLDFSRTRHKNSMIIYSQTTGAIDEPPLLVLTSIFSPASGELVPIQKPGLLPISVAKSDLTRSISTPTWDGMLVGTPPPFHSTNPPAHGAYYSVPIYTPGYVEEKHIIIRKRT